MIFMISFSKAYTLVLLDRDPMLKHKMVTRLINDKCLFRNKRWTWNEREEDQFVFST